MSGAVCLTEWVFVPGEDGIFFYIAIRKMLNNPFPHVESFTFSRKLNLRVPMLIKPPTAVEAYLFALLLPPLHLMSE